MVQLVRDQGVLLAQKGLEHSQVGVKAGGIQDGILHAQKFGDLPLQFLVLVLGAADEADRGHAEAPFLQAFLGRGHDGRVAGEPQIVVGAEVDDLLLGRIGRVLYLDAGRLGRVDVTLLLEKIGVLQFHQFVAVKFLYLDVKCHDELVITPCVILER